jgi:hypothetical protein
MKRCFKVTSRHCRANLVFGRIPVKRQILSVHVYDKISLRMVYAKRVKCESETISLCVAKKVPNHDVTS